MKKASIFLIFLVTILYSCTTKETTKAIKPEHISGEIVVGSNDYILGFPQELVVTNSSLILQDKRMSSIFHVINKDKSISSFGRIGNGPDEFLYPGALFQYPVGDSLCMVDSNKRVLYSLKATDNQERPYMITKIANLGEICYLSALPMRNGRYISNGYFTDARFYLLNSSGEIISTYKNFPCKNEKESKLPKIVLAQAYYSNLASDDSGERFVTATINGEILSFYRLNGNSIEKTNEICDRYPEFIYEKDEYKAIDRNIPIGYISVAASDRYIYLLYSGRSYADYKDKAFVGSDVIVYDWDGNIVRHLILDKPAYLIRTPKGDDTYLYAVRHAPECEIVRYKI